MSKKPYYFLTNISVEGVLANGQIGNPGDSLLSNGNTTYWGTSSSGSINISIDGGNASITYTTTDIVFDGGTA